MRGHEKRLAPPPTMAIEQASAFLDGASEASMER
jgi:hypothetical protein